MTESLFSNITVDELFKLSGGQPKIHVLDVREQDEWDEVHAPIARLVPLSRIMEGRADEDLRMPKDEPVYVICRSGRRSASACEILSQHGFQNLTNVTGGMEAWMRAGLPHVRA